MGFDAMGQGFNMPGANSLGGSIPGNQPGGGQPGAPTGGWTSGNFDFPVGSFPGGNAGAFPQTGNNKFTGASRQIGEFGDFPVGQVDVRTDFMKALESAVAPMLFQILLNPGSISQGLGSLGGPVPGRQQSGLGSMLFGGPTGQASGSQPAPKVDAKAMGGPLDPNAMTLVGEAGPELISPAGAGGQQQVMPLQRNRRPAMSQRASAAQTPFALLSGAGATPSPGIPLGDAGIPGRPIGGVPVGDSNSYLPVGNFPSAGMGGLMQRPRGLQFRAAGGPLDPEAFTMVGEAGPEFITPAVDGATPSVIPLEWNPVNSAANPPASDPGGSGGLMPPPIAPPTTTPNPLPDLGLGGGTIPGANPGSFPTGPQQGAGTGMLERLLRQNPEMDAFNSIQQLLMGKGGILGGGNAGKGVLRALKPMYQQNLQFGLNELRNAAPSVANTGFAIQGTDLASRALNDYNLMASQALLQGQQNTLGGMGILGQLAGQAGNGAFNRALGAGQLDTQRQLGFGSLDLQQQQQQWNQTTGPMIQMLLAAMGMATPTGYQTVVPGKK